MDELTLQLSTIYFMKETQEGIADETMRRYSERCNSGVDALAVNNWSLIRFKVCFVGENSCPLR